MAVVLIGPWCAGKSSLGRRYAQILGREFFDLDDLAPRYGAEIGWSLNHLFERNREVGMLASEKEWEPIRAHAAERSLVDYPDAIVAFGASYTDYFSVEQRERVRNALVDPRHLVARVTPSFDDELARIECLRRARLTRGPEWVSARMDFPSWSPSRMAVGVADVVVENPTMSHLLAPPQSFESSTSTERDRNND